MCIYVLKILSILISICIQDNVLLKSFHQHLRSRFTRVKFINNEYHKFGSRKFSHGIRVACENNNHCVTFAFQYFDDDVN